MTYDASRPSFKAGSKICAGSTAGRAERRSVPTCMAIEKAMGADRRKAGPARRFSRWRRDRRRFRRPVRGRRRRRTRFLPRQQAAAHRLVLGRLPRWRPTPTSISAVVAASLKQLRWEDRLWYRNGRLGLARFPQAARQHGRPSSVNHVVGQLVEIERGQAFHSGPRDDPPTGAVSRTQPRRQRCSSESVAIELGGRKHPRPPAAGRNLLLRRRRTSDTSSKPPPRSADAIRRKLDGCVRLRCGPRRSPFQCPCTSGQTKPLTSSCAFRSTKSSPTSKDGREASYVTGTCARKAICRPISDLSSSGRFNRRQEPVYAELSTLALPPRHQPAEPLTSTACWQTLATGAMCISGIPDMTIISQLYEIGNLKNLQHTPESYILEATISAIWCVLSRGVQRDADVFANSPHMNNYTSTRDRLEQRSRELGPREGLSEEERRALRHAFGVIHAAAVLEGVEDYGEYSSIIRHIELFPSDEAAKISE